MDNAFSTALGPILVLWIGALILYVLDRFLQPQDRGTAEAVVLVLALGFLLNARSAIGLPLELGPALSDAARPGVPPFLILSHPTWLLSTLVLGSATMSSLASFGASTVGRSGRLATLGSTLLFLVAGDWPTLALAWMLVDISLLCTLNAGGAQPKSLRWTAMLSMLGAVVLGVAWLLWRRDGPGIGVDRGGVLPIEALAVAAPWPRVAGLLALAGLLRVMPFPLPSWLAGGEDDETQETRPLARMIVSTIPTLLGAYLWARLGQWNVPQSVPWLGTAAVPIWGALIYASVGVKTWGVQDPDRLVACVPEYAVATVLLGAGLGMPPSWLLLLGGAATLSIATLYVAWTQCQHLDVFDVQSYWRAAPTLWMILSMAGLPLTVGFPTRIAIYWSLFVAGKWLSLLLVILGEIFLLGALLRIMLELECVYDFRAQAPDVATGDAAERIPQDRWWLRLLQWVRQVEWQREVGYGAGAVLAISLVILGVVPRGLSGVGLGQWFRLPTLPVWAALLLATVGAVVLYRSRDRVLDGIEAWWPLIRSLFSLDQVYQGIERILGYVGSLIWGATLVVEGTGYVAWVVLVSLVALLFIISR